MKHFKSFSNEAAKKNYLNNNFIAPYIYVENNTKYVDYEKSYIPVEYIRSTSTGGQYIDLGIGLFDEDPINFRITMNWMLYGHGITGTQQSTILCAALEKSPYPGLNIRTSADDKYDVSMQVKEDQHADWCWHWGSNKWGVKIYAADGTVLYDTSPGANPKVSGPGANNILIHFDYEFNFTSGQHHTVTTTLFCSKDGNGNNWRYIDARLDYLKLYKNGSIVRDLIPCINYQGIAGLYDKVFKKFYKSQGPDEFVAGPIKL